ncbi:MAG: MBG domain-containing protein, partial [Gillisia sp.]
MAEFLHLKKGKFLNFTLTFIASFFFLATGWGQEVMTDKDDYAPGEYVIITGTGWKPGERVDFTFEETPKPETCVNSHDNFAIADANGNIYYDGFLIKPNHVGVAFELTATGQSSGLIATAFFTDANSSVSNTSPSSASNDAIIILSARLTQAGTDNSCGSCVGNGNPIPGKTINFSINNGTFLGSGVTNANGEATFSWTVDQPVGTYNGVSGIKAEFPGDPGNNPYAGKSETKNFSISCANPSITIAPTAKTVTYGDPDPTFSVTATGTGLSYQWQYNTTAVPGTWNNVGTNSNNYTVPAPDVSFSGRTYRVVITGTCGNVTSTPVLLTVNKKTIAVTADAQSKVYGESDPALTYGFSPALIAGDSFSGALSRTGDENVGSYLVQQGTLALSDNYTLDFTGAAFDITKLTIAVTADAQSKVYGESDPALTYGFSPALVAGDSFSGALSRTGDENVGSYLVQQGTLALSDNYTLNFTGAAFDITKLTIAVTADAQSKVYGESDPALTYGFSPALVAGDSFSGALSRTGDENVGSYLVQQGTLALSDNYTLNFTGAAFDITKAVLTATADNQTKVYGAANPTLTFQYSGWVNGEETIDTAPAISTTVDGSTEVGTYEDAITLEEGVDNNYTFNLVTGDFTVTKAVLTATADNQTKVYGAANPTLTFQYSGWVNGEETIDTTPAISTTVDGSTEVGTYEDAITLSGGLDNNYTFNLVTGDFTVTKAVLTATADNQTKVYGA